MDPKTARPVRPIRRPAPASPAPTLIRAPRDTSLFRGWGITL
jgi:hypothetical protein